MSSDQHEPQVQQDGPRPAWPIHRESLDRLRSGPRVSAWLAENRRWWPSQLEALEEPLAEMGQPMCHLAPAPSFGEGEPCLLGHREPAGCPEIEGTGAQLLLRGSAERRLALMPPDPSNALRAMASGWQSAELPDMNICRLDLLLLGLALPQAARERKQREGEMFLRWLLSLPEQRQALDGSELLDLERIDQSCQPEEQLRDCLLEDFGAKLLPFRTHPDEAMKAMKAILEEMGLSERNGRWARTRETPSEKELKEQQEGYEAIAREFWQGELPSSGIRIGDCCSFAWGPWPESSWEILLQSPSVELSSQDAPHSEERGSMVETKLDEKIEQIPTTHTSQLPPQITDLRDRLEDSLKTRIVMLSCKPYLGPFQVTLYGF